MVLRISRDAHKLVRTPDYKQINKEEWTSEDGWGLGVKVVTLHSLSWH